MDYNELDSFLAPQHAKRIKNLLLDDSINLTNFDRYGLIFTNEKASIGFSTPTSSPSQHDPKIWNCIKKEVFDYFCTDSEKYRKEQLIGGASVSSAIAYITKLVSTSLGISIDFIIPAVTFCFYLVLKIGKNSYCSSIKP